MGTLSNTGGPNNVSVRVGCRTNSHHIIGGVQTTGGEWWIRPSFFHRKRESCFQRYDAYRLLMRPTHVGQYLDPVRQPSTCLVAPEVDGIHSTDDADLPDRRISFGMGYRQ